MGQRHQVYLCVNDDENKKTVVGIHHQWLYGYTAISRIERMVKFLEVQSTPDSRAFNNHSLEILRGMYSLVPEEGYFHEVSFLDRECEDPRRGDNNDGITIFDFRNLKTPKYCLMSIRHLGGEADSPEALVPLSAEQYFNIYYPKFPETDKEQVKQIKSTLKYLSKIPVMTIEACKEIFPKMYQ